MIHGLSCCGFAPFLCVRKRLEGRANLRDDEKLGRFEVRRTCSAPSARTPYCPYVKSTEPGFPRGAQTGKRKRGVQYLSCASILFLSWHLAEFDYVVGWMLWGSPWGFLSLELVGCKVELWRLYHTCLISWIWCLLLDLDSENFRLTMSHRHDLQLCDNLMCSASLCCAVYCTVLNCAWMLLYCQSS